MRTFDRFPACFLLVALAHNSPAMAVDVDFFESKIRPLLVERCYECHSAEADEAMGGVRLDSAPAMLRGGDSGPAVVPGDVGKSVLVRAIEYKNFNLQMPPEGKLDIEEIDAIKLWISGGAPDPRTEETSSVEESLSPMQRPVSSHWAFVPPQRIPADTLSGTGSLPSSVSYDPIDVVAAVAAESVGLTINPPADRATWLRRLSFDLHGLPPTAEAIERFASDRRPDAARRQADRMLADPRYAERFTRHWLDVSRYADTRGYGLAGVDRELNGAYRYRDWVLRAIAADMPYAEMIRHQLAGDRTDPMNDDGHADAMGFLTLGRRFLGEDDIIDDRIDVITRGLLGLTVACSRCHDHKFDPIPTVDYYSLYSVLSNSVPPPGVEKTRRKREGDKSSEISEDVLAIGQRAPLSLIDRTPLSDTRVFIRGQRGNRGDVAPRRYLTAFRSTDELFDQGSGRLDLAEQIGAPENPLASRVLVNRVWGHLIGQPLVTSASDFGFRTEPPSIPGVLDDLAVQFARDGSWQRLIRRIVSTRIYGQSSSCDERSFQLDPDNVWLARAERKRLDFESLRDSVLWGCQERNERFGGESIEIAASAIAPRRTVYARVDRQQLPGVFRNFDFASPDMHSPRRYETTVPQQALFLMNHPQMAAAAKLAVGRLTEQVAPPLSKTPAEAWRREPQLIDHEAFVEALFRKLLSRSPSSQERVDAIEFLSTPERPYRGDMDLRTAWTYGVGTLTTNGVERFTPFKFFKTGQWQVDEDFPSPGPLSYATLWKDSGHPAHGDEGVVIRRFTSPITGTAKVLGQLSHDSREGDGIIAIVRTAEREFFRNEVYSRKRPVGPMMIPIREGESIDFIAHSNKTISFDSFTWQMQISVTAKEGHSLSASSSDNFSGPLSAEVLRELSEPRGLSRRAQLAHVLMMTDEFAWLD